MPTNGESLDLLVDTSVAVALVVSDHEHHRSTVRALRGRRLGLAGHAAFETFSVLTRLPPPLRRTPQAVHRLPVMGVAGGAVYDALVGATASQHGMRLATRDRRAVDTYRALDVDLEILR
jgi:predicted nucleic acid-binding protein